MWRFAQQPKYKNSMEPASFMSAYELPLISYLEHISRTPSHKASMFSIAYEHDKKGNWLGSDVATSGYEPSVAVP